MASKKSQGELPPTSPITFRPCSNGEYSPKPETRRDRRAEELFLRIVEETHKRVGMTRRAFSQSSCGMAAALLVINQVYGCGSSGGSGQVGGAGTGNGTGGSGSAGMGTGGSNLGGCSSAAEKL